MVRLFNSRETNFSHNQYVLNEIISCKVTEELNGDYMLDLEYPLEDSKGISSNLVVGSVLSVPSIDSRENQLFSVIKKETNSNSISVQAQAKLMADLKVNAVRAATINGKTRKEAVQIILNGALDSHDYNAGNLDLNTNADIILQVSEGNLLSNLIGSENSVLSEYGGEFIVSNNTIDIVNQRGQDNGVIIEYGKNLSSIEEAIDLTDFATVLIPKSGDYRLPEYSIESPNVGAYEKRYFKEVDLNLNIWDGTNEKKDDQVTITEAYTLMRATCNKMFTLDKVDQMAFNYTVDFVQLSQTEEYKNYSILETVNLGDTVTIKHSKLNLNLQGRVNKISYTVDSEGITTIDTVEIGFNRKDITDIIKTTVKSIKFAQDEIRLALNNSISGVETELKLANDKISAVVQSKGVGMGWTLNQEEFKVACVGASGANVTINSSGLTVNNGKIMVKNSSGDTVFKVNTNGKCNAIGGFIVNDGATSTSITANGLKLDGTYSSWIKPHPDKDGIYIPNDLYCDDFHTGDACLIGGSLEVTKNATIKEHLFVTENIYLNGESLQDIIDSRINALK